MSLTGSDLPKADDSKSRRWACRRFGDRQLTGIDNELQHRTLSGSWNGWPRLTLSAHNKSVALPPRRTFDGRLFVKDVPAGKMAQRYQKRTEQPLLSALVASGNFECLRRQDGVLEM